jgi:hypothetical protein
MIGYRCLGGQGMNVARIIFGVIYLLGAAFNIFMVSTQGWQIYAGFADGSFWPFYREAWQVIAAFNIAVFVILLIVFEIVLGLLFIISRKCLKIALILGVLFCLASMPVMIQAIYTNLPLAIIQGVLLWLEFRGDKAVRKI